MPMTARAEALAAPLLQGIAEMARIAFHARAASIAVLDRAGRELVFAGVAGEGAERLVGARFQAREGLAGRVLESRRALAVRDVGADPRFGRGIAEETGYVPDAILAAPLLRGGEPWGVVSVLDPAAADREDEQLGLLARVAAGAEAMLELAEAAAP